MIMIGLSPTTQPNNLPLYLKRFNLQTQIAFALVEQVRLKVVGTLMTIKYFLVF